MAMFKRENWGVGSAKIACMALLSGIMALSMPMTAMAGTYYVDEGSVTVNATADGQTVTQNQNTVSDDSPVISNRDSETPTANDIYIQASDTNSTANVTLSNVNIDCSTQNRVSAVRTGGSGNINIELNGNNTLKSGGIRAALQDGCGGMLTIKDENGDGSLRAEGGANGGAGIGSAVEGMADNITISGGTIVAIGGAGDGTGGGAGIGGGKGSGGGNCGVAQNIIISGGNVTATGGEGAAGIGGGSQAAGSDITISGGTVTANGGNYGGAGIGGGKLATGSNIAISGGTVLAVGGYDGGAGIGGGLLQQGTGIMISGSAQVSAAGGQANGDTGAGAGIGGGGRHEHAAGAESVNTSNLYTTGSVRRYTAGTTANNMTEQNLDPANPPIVGSMDSNAPASAPASSVSSDSSSESSGSGNNNDSGSPSQPTVNGFAVFLSTLNTQIDNNLKQVNTQIASGNLEAAKAKYPDGYTINTGNWISFKRDTYELLDKLIQAGVPVIINFTYKGKSYSVTIPAGSAVSLVSLCNKEGYCGFMNLYRVFGGTVK